MPLPILPLRRLGQHFLVDPNTAGRIAGSLCAPVGAPVVEIGAGTGALTGLLLERHPDLVALEVDARAVRHLEALHPLLDVRRCDVLELNWTCLADECGGPLHLVGNLPYNITSPILFGLLPHRRSIAQAVFMMQREVAERLVAQPGSKTYGVPSVLIQLFAEPRLLFRVSRSVFRPKPAVRECRREDEFWRGDGARRRVCLDTGGCAGCFRPASQDAAKQPARTDGGYRFGAARAVANPARGGPFTCRFCGACAVSSFDFRQSAGKIRILGRGARNQTAHPS